LNRALASAVNVRRAFAMASAASAIEFGMVFIVVSLWSFAVSMDLNLRPSWKLSMKK
jgi:hypothetical protein